MGLGRFFKRKKRRRIVLQAVEPRVGVVLEEWSLQTIDDLDDVLLPVILRAVAEVLDIVFTDAEGDYLWPSLPIIWAPGSDGRCCGRAEEKDHQPVSDPLTVYLVAEGFSAPNKRNPAFSFSFGELVRETVEQCAEDGSWGYGLRLARKEMLKLCDEIEAALESGKNATGLPIGPREQEH